MFPGSGCMMTLTESLGYQAILREAKRSRMLSGRLQTNPGQRNAPPDGDPATTRRMTSPPVTLREAKRSRRVSF